MKQMKTWILVVLFLLVLPCYCIGAAETETTESEKPPTKLYPFPVIFSSPETGYALGAMLYYYPNIEVSSSE